MSRSSTWPAARHRASLGRLGTGSERTEADNARIRIEPSKAAISEPWRTFAPVRIALHVGTTHSVGSCSILIPLVAEHDRPFCAVNVSARVHRNSFQRGDDRELVGRRQRCSVPSRADQTYSLLR